MVVFLERNPSTVSQQNICKASSFNSAVVMTEGSLFKGVNMRLKIYLENLSFLLFAGLLLATAVMADSEQCLKCHQDLLDSSAIEMVVHRPFSQNRCALCHSTTDEVTTEEVDQKEERVSETNDRGRIEWLAESFAENTLQVALLPVDICNSDLILKLWYQNRDKQQKTIHCPDNAAISIDPNPQQRPAVSLFQRHNYNDKLFTRATLSWITNVPCRCKLLYHSDNHEYVDDEDDFYTVVHGLEIRNFNPANTQVSVECDDTFQQHTQVQFTPITMLPMKAESPEESPSQEVAEFATDFRRIGDAIEITISTTQPAAIALGRNEEETPPLQVPQPEPSISAATLPAATEHPPLTQEKQVNTTVCFQCHKETVEVASHPINVLAPPGMIIPPEYPLLSDGRMTCMTCHARHSSNNEARLLKEGKKELCIGCHKNY